MQIMVTKLAVGWVFASIYTRLLVIILFSIGLYLLFQIFKRTSQLKFIWVFLLAILPGLAISFLEPIYDVDYGLWTDDKSIENITGLELASDYTFNGEYNVLLFATTNCPHCKATAKKLALNVAAGQKIRVSTFFSGSEEDAINFLAENDASNFDYHLIEPDSVFLNFSGNSFPSIYLIRPDGSTIHHWKGDMMNYSALDLIANLP